MNRPTKSKDGVYRSTLMVHHRVDLSVIILAIIDLAHQDQREISAIGQMKKGEVERHLRRQLTEGGYNWITFGWERVEPDYWKQAYNLAESSARVLFPDFTEETRI